MADEGGATELLQCLSINYLALGQFELARGVLQELKRTDHSAALNILQSIAERRTTLRGWLASTGVPSYSHLVWLTNCELALTPGEKKLSGEEKLLENEAHIERELLQVIAASLRDKAISDPLLSSDGGPLKAQNETLWQSQPSTLQNASGQAAVFPSREVLSWLLEHEPQLFRSLVDQDTSSPATELLTQQWERALSRADFQGVAHTIAQIVKEGGDESLKKHRVLLARTLELSKDGAASETSRQSQTKLWAAATASGSARIDGLLEAAQDDLVASAAGAATSAGSLSPPLAQLRASLHASQEEGTDSGPAVEACAGDLFQHARVTRSHVLESVVREALSAAQAGDMQLAADILRPFPELAPLLAVMAWDLHGGSVNARQDALQRLWHQRAHPTRPRHSQVSPLEAVCGQLAYQLHVAQTIAAASSGEDTSPADSFAVNLMLDRLGAASPAQVLTDPALRIPPETALRLVSQQPAAHSKQEAQARQHDSELLRMHLALQSALRALEQAASQSARQAEAALREAGQHMDDVRNPWKKAWLVVTVASLLQLPPTPRPLIPAAPPPLATSNDPPLPAPVLAAHFVSFLQHHLPRAEAFPTTPTSKAAPSGTRVKTSVDRGIPLAAHVWAQKAAAWHTRLADWQWRLQLLGHVAEAEGQPATWHECVAGLAAPPSQLLDRCTRAGEYGLARQVATRYSLSAAETSALELAEWMDHAAASLAGGQSTRAGSKDGLDLAPLSHRLSPLTTLLACLDLALSAAPSSGSVSRLLVQARGLAEQCREQRASALPGIVKDGPGPDGAPSARPSTASLFNRRGQRGSTGSAGDEERRAPADEWDSPRVRAVFEVADSLLQYENALDRQSREPGASLSALLAASGETASEAPFAGAHAGPDVRAITALQAAIKDAHDGKRQFLSGKLHNLVKALADREPDTDLPSTAKPKHGKQALLSLLGLGLQPATRPLSPASKSGDLALRLGAWGSALDGVGDPPTSPLAAAALLDTGGARASALAALVHYVASIGDIMDEVDTTHTYNFFAILYQSPAHLLAQLAFERGSTDTASRAAELMGVDLVRQLLSSSLRPLLPPAYRTFPPPPLPGQSLQVEVAQFLARSSPQQAVLAAWLGSLSDADEPKLSEREAARRRGLRELALSRGKSFAALRRWLLLQEDLPASPVISPPTPSPANLSEANASPARFKRLRPIDSSEADATPPADAKTSLAAAESRSGQHSDSLAGRKTAQPEAKHNPSGLVEWEDKGLYSQSVRELLARGSLQEALEIADSRLIAGAPDELLLAVIEHEAAQGDHEQETRGETSPSVQLQGWQACMRLRDKQTAAQTALRCVRHWGRQEGSAVLAACAAHLPTCSTFRDELVQRGDQLARYQRLLDADPSLDTWQQVEDVFVSDPEGLALRLSSKGAVPAALEVARAAGLRDSLRHELQSRQLAHILGGDVARGGGPAAALRYLRELSNTGDAMAVVTGALPQLTHVKDKSLLVRYLLSHSPPDLSQDDTDRLRSLAAGLAALASLPPPWQQRCGHLAEHPALVLESLLMAQQFQTARQMLRTCPSLHNDALVVRYAAKALAPPSTVEAPSTLSARPSKPGPSSPLPRRTTSPEYHRTGSLAVPRLRSERLPGSGLRSISTAGGLRGVLGSPDGQSTPRRISWAAGTSTMWAAASQFTRGLLQQSGDGSDSPRAASKGPPTEQPLSLPPSQSAAWEAMSGPLDARGATVPSGTGRLVADAGLTGDAAKDERSRKAHAFQGAPSAAMLKALLPLCSDVPSSVRLLLASVEEVVGAAFAVPPTSEAMLERGLRAADAYVEALRHLEGLLTEAAAAAADKAPLARLRSLLPQVEMVQALLRAGVPVSLPQLRAEAERRDLHVRLCQEERFELAHALCTKCGVSVESVELAWGRAALATRDYQPARTHLRAALELLPEPARVEAVQSIVAAIEGAPPADLPHTRTLYQEMARSVALSSEEAFSFDAYLNVLNAPPEPRPPPSRRSSGEQPETAGAHAADSPGDSTRDYLDDERKDEALGYLLQFHPSGVLPFLFRHGRFAEACQLFLAHLPPPVPPTPPLPEKPAPRAASDAGEALVSDVGTLEELCELAVTHGAMPAMEKALQERSNERGEESGGQYAAVLAKMAAFCEAHRHFHHLYRIQLLQKDPVAAGLTCIQLFQNSATADEAVKHLEAARDHFDDGLAQRQAAAVDGGIPGRRAKEGRKRASAKLSEEEIIKFSTRTALQAEVVRAFGDGEGPPWRHSLFGNPSDPETQRRRSVVAEQLAERNFDLAFRIIYDFRLPAVATYAGAAASLAAKRCGSGVAELLRNITGTIDAGERDQVVMAAVQVFAGQHKEHPTQLIDQLSNSHRKVLACVASGRLKSAFQFASRADSTADVQLVAHQARETGQLNVMDLCHQWLAKKMQSSGAS